MSGPYDRWPTGSGFDKFYGFIGGETNQWAPAIFDGVTRVEVPTTPGYHFTTDMTNNAINWVSAQKSLTPDKPFYMYFATGRYACPASRPEGMDREVQRAVCRRVGQASRGNLRPTEGVGRRPG